MIEGVIVQSTVRKKPCTEHPCGELRLPIFFAVCGGSGGGATHTKVNAIPCVTGEGTVAPFIKNGGVFPIVKGHTAQVCAGNGTASPRVGNHRHLGLGFNHPGAVSDFFGNVIHSKQTEIAIVTVSVGPTGGTHFAEIVEEMTPSPI